MGVKKSGYVRDEDGNLVVGQTLQPRWLEMETHPARAWSDQRYRDYERRARYDSFPRFAAQTGLDEATTPPREYRRAVQEFMDRSVAAFHRRYPERLRDAGDLERAAATPVPDDDDLADNTMNLRRRIMGQ